MKLLPLICFFVLIIAFRPHALAQSQDDQLVPGQINFKFLEHLVKEQIDSVRIAHHLKALVNDSILYLAANDHSKYLIARNKMGHFQEDIPKKRTPSDRVAFYGAKDFDVIGENVISTFVLMPMKYKIKGKEYEHESHTYREAAIDMMIGWVNSPHHFANIIDPAYELTGVALDYDSIKHNIKCTQDFGYKKFEYIHHENKNFFNYSDYKPPVLVSSFDKVSHTPHAHKHAWQLTAPEDTLEDCASCSDLLSDFKMMQLIPSGKNIYLQTDDIEMVKRFLQNKDDGFAVEFMVYDPYACNNPQYYEYPSRRNGQCIFSGKVSQPVYREKLLNGFKKKKRLGPKEKKSWFPLSLFVKSEESINDFTAESYYAKVGKFPKSLSGYIECNLVIIQNKKVCRVVHFSGNCGDRMTFDGSVVDQNYLSERSFELKPLKASFQFTIPFDKKKAEFKYADIKPFLDSLTSNHFRVLDIDVKAFSSVEGTEKVNAQIQEKRAENILNAIQTQQDEPIAITSSSTENWDLFYSMVKRDPVYSYMARLKKEEIKSLLERDTIVKHLEPLLAAERKAVIKMNTIVFPKPSCDNAFIKGKWKTYVDSVRIGKNKAVFIDSLDRLQWYIYSNLLNKCTDTSCLYLLKCPVASPFDSIALNELWMENFFLHHDSAWKDEYYARTKQLALPLKPPLEAARFNTVNFLLDNWKEKKIYDKAETPVKMADLIDELSTDFDFNAIDSMKLKYHFNAAEYYYSDIENSKDKSKITESLVFIFSHYYKKEIDDSLGIRLTKFFIRHKQPSWAMPLIKPLLEKENVNHELLSLYLKIIFEHPEEHPDHEYVNLLMKAHDYLTREEWCDLFVGPCNISFQIFDDEALRNLYCKDCSGKHNYAEDPSQWKTEKSQ